MISTAKDPAKVRAGQIGMRARWGPQRTLRLTDLSPEKRALILALVAQEEAPSDNEVAPTVIETSVRAKPEARHDHHDHAASTD